MTVAASNFERILACAGAGKQALIEREVPLNARRMLKNRGQFNGPINSEEVARFPEVGFSYIYIAPILSYDECFGGIMAFSESPIEEDAVRAIKLAGKLMGNALQKY